MSIPLREASMGEPPPTKAARRTGQCAADEALCAAVDTINQSSEPTFVCWQCGKLTTGYPIECASYKDHREDVCGDCANYCMYCSSDSESNPWIEPGEYHHDSVHNSTELYDEDAVEDIIDTLEGRRPEFSVRLVAFRALLCAASTEVFGDTDKFMCSDLNIPHWRKGTSTLHMVVRARGGANIVFEFNVETNSIELFEMWHTGTRWRLNHLVSVPDDKFYHRSDYWACARGMHVHVHYDRVAVRKKRWSIDSCFMYWKGMQLPPHAPLETSLGMLLPDPKEIYAPSMESYPYSADEILEKEMIDYCLTYQIELEEDPKRAAIFSEFKEAVHCASRENATEEDKRRLEKIRLKF